MCGTGGRRQNRPTVLLLCVDLHVELHYFTYHTTSNNENSRHVLEGTHTTSLLEDERTKENKRWPDMTDHHGCNLNGCILFQVHLRDLGRVELVL